MATARIPVAGTARMPVADSRRPAPRTILLVPFADGIGDFVNMLPIVQAVRARYSGARLTVAASEHARYLLPNDDVTVRTPSWLRRQTSPRAVRLRWLVSQRLVAALSSLGLRGELGRFDLTINLFRAWERGMAFERDWTPQVPARRNAVHSLDFLADQLSTWDIHLPRTRRTPRLAVRPDARAWAAAEWRRRELDDGPVVGLVPASNMVIKQWPLPEWARVNDALRRAGARTVLFLPAQTHPSAQLLAMTDQPPTPLVTDLLRVAGALERCQLVLAVDTGLLHMAAAVGTPYVGLFGPTNPDATGPYDRQLGVCLVAQFPKVTGCRGCWKTFKYEDDRCRAFSQSSCAAWLDGQAVIQTSLTMLERGWGHHPNQLR